MAENEIRKHTKKAFVIFKSNMNFKNKLKEMLLEIIIIVFAVSVSIWFHNWSERIHERGEEKEFLVGLKKDLQSDIENMTHSKEFYVHTLWGIKYFLNVGKGAALQKDSIAKYSGVFFGSTDLDPHIGRYEGLKSSGKFKIIRNKELLNNVIDFHETIVQRIQNLNEKYYHHSEKLEAIVAQNLELSENGTISNTESVVKRNDIRILLKVSWGLIVGNIIDVHNKGIMKCKEIITQIDKELK